MGLLTPVLPTYLHGFIEIWQLFEYVLKTYMYFSVRPNTEYSASFGRKCSAEYSVNLAEYRIPKNGENLRFLGPFFTSFGLFSNIFEIFWIQIFPKMFNCSDKHIYLETSYYNVAMYYFESIINYDVHT